MFFAAVLLVTAQRFSEDSDILADLVNFREQPARVMPETAMECVRSAVWVVLYADDACVVSQSSQGLEGMMATVVHVGAFDLTVTKIVGNFELDAPICPRNAYSIHHNGATIPADYFLCLPRWRDYGKSKVIDGPVRVG